MDDAHRFPGDPDGHGDLAGLVIHQHHVRRLDGGVAAQAAHGDADVGAGQHRGVVDAVAHKGQLAGLLLQQLFHPGHLVGRQQLRVVFVQPQGIRHGVGHLLGVAGEHDRLFHAQGLQSGDGVLGVRLGQVGDDNMPGVEAVDGHVDDGARQFTGQPVHVLPLHQAAVAHAHGAAVHLGHDAVAGDLLHVSHPAGLHFLFAGFPLGHRNGMGGILLRQGGIFQHLVLHKARLGMDGGDGEGAAGQGTGLVEHHGVRLGQLFQIVAALHQDAALGGAADAAEKAQGHGDHQCAGAGDDQEGQGTVEPFRPGGARQEGGGYSQHRQQNGGDQEQSQGGIHHAGGVILGKAGDELLADRFFLAGIFHQLQNFGDRGFLAGLGDGDPQQARQVHAAADDIVPCMDVPGQGLAGEGGGIQGGAALQNGAVQRHPLAGLHHNDGAHGYIFRIHLFQAVFRF